MGAIKKIRNYKKSHSTKETIGWIKNAFLMKLRKMKNNKNDYKSLNIKDNENLLFKSNHKVFIFANVPFYDIGGGQRSSQLAKTFNKMGFPVYCIYALKSAESKIYNLEMPLCMHVNVKRISVDEVRKLMSKNDLAIFEAPVGDFASFLNVAKEKELKIVYENIDNWETSLGNEVFNKEVLDDLIKSSLFVVGSAKPLVKQLEGYMKELNVKKKALYLANAVDEELFSPLKGYSKPDDMVIGKKTLIYYGSLWGSWFDWDLITKLANKHPEYSFNMIGDTQHIVDFMKKLPENIHFLGLKKQADLPAYLEYSDYAMIPFKVDEIGEYVSPLKIFEYISMEKKVLCTKLPDVIGYPNTYTGNTYLEWEKYIEDNKSVDKVASKDFILHNNWRSRVTNIYKEAYGKEIEKCSKEFYNNISIIVYGENIESTNNCINSLISNNNRYNYDILVYSNDNEIKKKLEKEYKDKIVVVDKGNIKVKTDYLMFINNEKIVLHEYFLDPYLEVFSKKENVGAVGNYGYLIDDEQVVYPILDGYYMYPSVIARSDIHALDTDCIMTKKDIFEKIGYINEKKYNNIELSQKIKEKKGIYYCPYLGVANTFLENNNKNVKKSVK